MGDKALGGAMLVGGVIALIIYLLALFFWGVGSTAWQLAITVVAVIAVGAVCVILIWIGYTLITTPAPAPSFDPAQATAETKPEEGTDKKDNAEKHSLAESLKLQLSSQEKKKEA